MNNGEDFCLFDELTGWSFVRVCMCVCDRLSLCSLDCPRVPYVAQTILELTEILCFCSQVLGLKAFVTTPGVSRVCYA